MTNTSEHEFQILAVTRVKSEVSDSAELIGKRDSGSGNDITELVVADRRFPLFRIGTVVDNPRYGSSPRRTDMKPPKN